MGIIKQMPERLANQIAAGEVVERPASVVKELVENSIDANSKRILIELVEAGIQSIRISDDGKGMEESDLIMSVLPHATSKIYELHDLFQIQSLGFRGEALASIASVAKVTIESTVNQPDSKATQGYYIKVNGSEVVKQGIIAPRLGTVITVESLFYNTPARLKHLSSIKTELRHILNFIQQIALAYPEIRFTLVSDGSQIFSSYGTGDLRQAIATVYQAQIARELLPIESENDDFRITGFISPPQLTRTSKYYIHWLINGRVVQSYALTQMLLKAYGRQLMIGRYPVAVINIELDPQLVDVNVHPTKQTVRLSKEPELGFLLTQAIVKVLEEVNPVPQLKVEDVQQPSEKNPFYQHEISKNAENLPFDLTAQPALLAEQKSDSIKNSEAFPVKHNVTENVADESPTKNEIQAAFNDQNVFETDIAYQEISNQNVSNRSNRSNRSMDTELSPNLKTGKVSFFDLRYVGQIHGTYLIAESQSGFYLIDQHAAQEKLRYERLMKTNNKSFDQQQLLFPYVFQFSPADANVVEQLLERYESLGLYLSNFGPNTFQLDSYPNWLDENQIEKTVHDLVTILQENADLSVNQLLEKTIVMQSCRGAIKANHYLSDIQAEALIRDMATLDDPYHCPHGRPVFVEFNQTTLEKLFKRIMDAHESGHHL